MAERYEKVVFRREGPLCLRYGMEYYPGCFTPTGLRKHHTDPIKEWSRLNHCGHWSTHWEEYQLITFDTEEDLTHFMLRWG